MKVKELIEALQDLDQEAYVTYNRNGEHIIISSVIEITDGIVAFGANQHSDITKVDKHYLIY